LAKGEGMANIEYDIETDSLYVNISSKHAYVTLEIGEKLALDLSKSNIPVGVEILEASKFISELFGRNVSKEAVGKMLCKVSQKDAIYLDFELAEARKESARLAIPGVYRSPIAVA